MHVITLALAGILATDPIPSPAHAAQQEGEEAKPSPPAGETVVRATELREEERIGSYAQPRWTAIRRFPGTRIYVVPEGTVQVEYWLEGKTPLGTAGDTRFRSQLELELGLGHRLQLDLYVQTEQEGTGALELLAEKAELRYAFADWGALPGNPTLYLEWKRESGGGHFAELKLLLGGELSRRLHWGANLVWERELFGAGSNEYALTAGMAYTVLDETLSAGAELKSEVVDVRFHRFNPSSYEVLAGPSLQYRPVRRAHLTLVTLFGWETERDLAAATAETVALFEPTLIVGLEF